MAGTEGASPLRYTQSHEKVVRAAVTHWGIAGRYPTVAEWNAITDAIFARGIPLDTPLALEPDSSSLPPTYRVTARYEIEAGA